MHIFQSNKSHCVNELGKPSANRKDGVVYVMYICHYWVLFSSDYVNTTYYNLAIQATLPDHKTL